MIGDVIYSYLTGNTEIQNFCSGRIYPLVLPETFDKHNTEVPFIIYSVSSVQPRYNKSVSGRVPVLYDITIDFGIYAYKYADLQDGFDVLNNVIHVMYGTISDYRFSSVTLESAFEDYLDGVNLRAMMMSFTFIVQKIT